MVGHVVAVDHDEEAAGVVSGEIEAAHADAVIGTVIAGVEAADGGQGFAEGAVAVLAEVFGGEDGDAGGGVF